LKTITTFVFNLSARILFTIVSVLSGFFLVRYLGPTQYGIIGIYTTLLQFIPGLICYSFFDSYGKEFAQKGLDPKVFSEAVITISAGALISVFVLLSLVTFLNSVVDMALEFWVYILLSIHLVFYLINAMYERALEAIGKSPITSSVQFLTGFITVASVVYVIALRQGIFPYLIGQLLISAVSLITYILYLKRTGLLNKFIFYFDPANFKKVFRYSFSIYIAQLYSQVSQRLPVFVAQKFYGLAYVSFLNVPLNLFGRLYLPAYSLSTVLSPKFGSGDEKSNLKNFEYGLRLILLIFIPASAFFLAGSNKLIPLLYGNKFIEAVIPAVILAPFLLFFAIDIFLNSIINYLGLANRRLKYIKYAGIIDLLAIVLGTMFFGFYGLLSSFSISIFVLAVIDFYIIKTKVNIEYGKVVSDIIKITLCTVPVLLFCLLAHNLQNITYLAGCCIVGCVYIGLVYISGVITKDDVLKLFGSFTIK